MFAAQLDGAEVRTVESLASADGALHPIQQAFTDEHGLQCGFCTPGMLMATVELLEHTPLPGPDDVREALGGQPVPVHRLPEHRQRRVRRRAPRGREPGHRHDADRRGRGMTARRCSTVLGGILDRRSSR